MPKALVREINERIDYKGAEIFPLEEKQAKIAIRELLGAGVEAMAVSLLWSFRNPAHELHRRINKRRRHPAPSLQPRVRSPPHDRAVSFPAGVCGSAIAS